MLKKIKKFFKKLFGKKEVKHTETHPPVVETRVKEKKTKKRKISKK